MRIRVITSPDALDPVSDLRDIWAAVVVDVLRATSTMAKALSLGAERILTFSQPERLLEKAGLIPRCITLGERGGKVLEGFDLGNSPCALEKGLVTGKTVLMTTTNGTRAIDALSGISIVVSMALVNRMAVARYLAERLRIEALEAPRLLILCSGWKGGFSAEDMAGAGALIEALDGLVYPGIELENDEALVASALFKVWNKDLSLLLVRTSHGKRLMRLGERDDISWCSGLDRLDVVPVMRSKREFVRAGLSVGR